MGCADSFGEFVRPRHAEPLRFAHVLTGDRHLAVTEHAGSRVLFGVPLSSMP
jgi:hypothetical protein